MREHETRRLNLVAQDREVVIIPEAAGKRVGPALESFHTAGSHGFEKLQLVPQILRLFAALVQVLVTGFLPHRPVAVAPGAIHTLESSPQDRPSAAGRPMARAIPYMSYSLPDGGQHVLFAKLPAAKRSASRCQASAHGAKGPPLCWRSTAGKIIERVAESLGVADLAERSRSIPKGVVLPPVLVLRKRRTRQSQGGARLLETLPRIMDRLAARCVAGTHSPYGSLRFPAQHALHASDPRLAPSQARCHPGTPYPSVLFD
jgi:hypothetical protein